MHTTHHYSKHSQAQPSPVHKAFTIVELLVVIIVIAILATLSVFAYTGIQKKATASKMTSELTQVKKAAEVDKPHFSGYPTTFPEDTQAMVSQDSTTVFHYYQRVGGRGFCADAYSIKYTDLHYHVDDTTDTVQEGLCSENTYTPPPSDGTMADNSPIQNVTQSQCQALPTYTGTNDSAIRTVTDTRGGTTRSYRIAKLADGKCWMLDNLKLGSTAATTMLTPADTDITSNFTLPQLITGGATPSLSVPRAYGPIPGDTGSGATNYGYLYNGKAAVAGASGIGTAPNSICAKGWRLPTGGSNGEFAMLNAKMNNPNTTSPSTSSGSGYYQNWQYNGPFKGVYSGGVTVIFAPYGSETGPINGGGSFANQGARGAWLSSNVYPGNGGEAYENAGSELMSNEVRLDGGWLYHAGGYAIRCVLK